MKAPHCDICGEAHWGFGRCPKFADIPKAERARKAVEATGIKAATEIKSKATGIKAAKRAVRPGHGDPVPDLTRAVVKSGRGGKRSGAGRKAIGKALTSTERSQRCRAKSVASPVLQKG